MIERLFELWGTHAVKSNNNWFTFFKFRLIFNWILYLVILKNATLIYLWKAIKRNMVEYNYHLVLRMLNSEGMLNNETNWSMLAKPKKGKDMRIVYGLDKKRLWPASPNASYLIFIISIHPFLSLPCSPYIHVQLSQTTPFSAQSHVPATLSAFSWSPPATFSH
jgi:hypothetical protein